jgi:Fe-S cluster assembly protein SufD
MGHPQQKIEWGTAKSEMRNDRVTTATKSAAQYLEHFTEFEKRAAGSELPWLRKLRREAFARFCEIGFPTTHDEDWRFTNVAAIANTTFGLAAPDSTFAEDRQMWATIDNVKLAGASCRLVFLNGRFAPELSTQPSAAGVTVSSFAQTLSAEPGLIEQHLGRYEDARRDGPAALGFSALNMAFAEDGAFVHIGRGVVVEKPIHLLFVSTLDEAPIMSHPRNLFLVDENSQASIVEEYVWLGGGSGLCNAVTELVAGDGAVLSHFRASHKGEAAARNGSGFNISTLRIHQGRSANVTTHSVLLGGTLVRNNVHPVLAGEGGECLINGLFLCAGSEHIDNYMLVEHASPHCGSRQFYNGILDGHARGVFHGRIIVHKDAQKTDAKQTNRNLLLSDDAQIDTKPQLEIHADDVKCTHGATIGQIEEDALFYLRSRGIEEDAARKLLLMAFAEECMARMQEGEARSHLEALVRQYLMGFSPAHRAQQDQRSA